jgi:hypothetical protein
MMAIQLHEHLDGDSPILAGAQQRVDRRQLRIEPYIHDAATHRHDRATIRDASSVCRPVPAWRAGGVCQLERDR